jgi:hypothetical protein
MTNRRWIVLTLGLLIALGLGLAAQSTDIEVVPGKLEIKSTASDALKIFGGITETNSVPGHTWIQTGAGADAGRWAVSIFSNTFHLDACNDANSVCHHVYRLARSGATPTNVDIFGGLSVYVDDTLATNRSYVRVGWGSSSPAPGMLQSGEDGVASNVVLLANNYASDGVGGSARINTSVGGAFLRLQTGGEISLMRISNAGALSTSAAWDAAGNMTQGGAIRGPNGSAGAPSYSFSGATSTGMFFSSALSFALSGTNIFTIDANGPLVNPQAKGTGGVSGQFVEVGRNTSGNGAAGTYRFERRDGTVDSLWSDAGTLRIGSPPTENDVNAHTGGTVVGTQTSSLDSKILLGERHDNDRMLRALLAAPVYNFRYRGGAFTHETFTGVVTDYTPALGMDPDAAHPHGRSLNVVNANGYTIGAIKALDQRLRALERKAGH